MEGGNKLLLPWEGATIIEKSVQTALSFSSEVYIVTGNDRSKILPLIEKYPVREIYNKDYKNGQETSIRIACKSLSGVLCFVPGDMPLLKREHFVEALLSLCGYYSARATYNGKIGHPVIISEDLVKVIRRDTQARVKDILKKYKHNAYPSSEEVILDIGTQEEYESLKKKNTP